MKLSFKTTIIVLTSFILVFACKRKEPEVPDYFLTKEQMIEVVTDVHLAEGYYRARQLKGPAPNFRDSLYAFVLKRHKITSEKLDSSYKFYIRREKDMNDIYDAVIDNLNHLEQGEKAPADDE